MAFNTVFESIVGTLQQDPSLVPGILGPMSMDNLRLYRAWPQFQSLLTTYEPNQPSEGWLVLEEIDPGFGASQEQYRSNHEIMNIMFHVYGTTYSVTHATLDVLDAYWHWEVDQQRDVQYGERYLFFTRRYREFDAFYDAAKIYEKRIIYRMTFVRDSALSP